MAKLVSRTYSEALFEVAVEEDILDKLAEELQFVIDTFNTYPDLFELYKSPQITVNERKEMVAQVFGDKISLNLKNFLKILIDKGRCGSFYGISDSFMDLKNKEKGIVHVVAETVTEMSDAQMHLLTEKLGKNITGTVLITNKINPDIMGGINLKIGDQVIDGSVKTKLEEIRDELAQIVI